MSKRPPFQVQDLGEIAIRCSNINVMFEFYRDIVGLPVLSDARENGIALFKICDGHSGHTTILALFLPDAGRPALHPHTDELPFAGKRSSLHHLALNVAFSEQDAVMRWLDESDVKYKVQDFGWIGWRGIFIEDPEGNTVEFVAADASVVTKD